MEEAWELAAVSSIVILAEALEQLVQARDFYDEAYSNELNGHREAVAFESGLNFSLRKMFKENKLSAEDFMLNLMLTIDDAEAKIQNSGILKESRKNYFVRKLSKLKRVLLYQSSSSGWDYFCDNICTEELLEDLKFIGEAMEDNELGTLIEADVSILEANVRELLDLARKSKISNKTKLAISAQLETILHILSEYKIFGADRMEGKLKILLSETLINYQELTETDNKLLGSLHLFIGENLKKMRSVASNIEAVKTIAALLGNSTS